MSRPDIPRDPCEFENREGFPRIFGDRYDEVVDALEGLDEQDRRIIEAIFWERITFEKLGQEIGLTKQGIHYRYTQALKKLGEVLDREDGD